MKNLVMAEAHRRARVRADAERLVGVNEWMLIEKYGRLTAGPHTGCYVSSLPVDAWLQIAKCLVAGETLRIHLMHRHRSGHHEASNLRWSNGELLAVFRDREEVA